MWKRAVLFLVLLLTLFNFSSIGYATTTVDVTKYTVLNPEKLSYSTSDKVILINGKAPSGTEITIDAYGTSEMYRRSSDSSRRTSYNLDNLPKEEDYNSVVTETVTSGNMGLFQKQMDLVNGINKLIINFGVEEVDPVEIIVYVRAKETRESNQTRITNFLPVLQ